MVAFDCFLALGFSIVYKPVSRASSVTRWGLLQTLSTLQRLIELWLTMLSSVASAVVLSVLGGVVSNVLATPVARQPSANILLSNDDGCESNCRFPWEQTCVNHLLVLIRGCGKHSRLLSRAGRCRLQCESQIRRLNTSSLTLSLSYTLRPFSPLPLRISQAPDLRPLRLLPSPRRVNLAVSP